MLFIFGLQTAIKRVQVNQDGLKLNGTHQFPVYADAVNILCGTVHTVQKNTQALVAASKEAGTAVSADKAQYMIMSGEQNAGQSHNVRIYFSAFETAEHFKYLE